MSQGQPLRPQADQEPIKFGDLFPVSGDLASKAVAPQDAAMMQTAETMVLGQTQKGGPAAVMQSAATRNESAGLRGHGDVTDVAGDLGVSVTETDVPGTRIITESVAGQEVGHYFEPMPMAQSSAGAALKTSAITIGEALEATARTAGNKPVEQSDAAAIQAAEARATVDSVITPGGLAASAQSATAFNAAKDRDEDKIKLKDVLTGATVKLAADKETTLEDATGVIGAELRNNSNLGTHPGGVAASVAAAASLNENMNTNTNL